jgi:hypothetical protein
VFAADAAGYGVTLCLQIGRSGDVLPPTWRMASRCCSMNSTSTVITDYTPTGLHRRGHARDAACRQDALAVTCLRPLRPFPEID